jgi:deoxyribodipyrimidine photolyase-related protein
VNERFPSHPGELDTFAWPVTRAQALQALDALHRERLPTSAAGRTRCGRRALAVALAPLGRAEPQAAEPARGGARRRGRLARRRAPLASAEGFIRQILGWREYVRGIYWTQMPGYLERNALDATPPAARLVLDRQHRHGLPADAIGRRCAGLCPPHPAPDGDRPVRAAAGRAPQPVHAWYLAVYVDAVEWVELPNTLGMSQFADGGLMASKPYVASGKYIERMSAGSCARAAATSPASAPAPRPAPSPRCTGTS